MKKYLFLVVTSLFVLVNQLALACNPELDGCLGCNDEELPACLHVLVQDVCQSAVNPGNCDTACSYHDAEHNI